MIPNAYNFLSRTRKNITGYLSTGTEIVNASLTVFALKFNNSLLQFGGAFDFCCCCNNNISYALPRPPLPPTRSSSSSSFDETLMVQSPIDPPASVANLANWMRFLYATCAARSLQLATHRPRGRVKGSKRIASHGIESHWIALNRIGSDRISSWLGTFKSSLSHHQVSWFCYARQPRPVATFDNKIFVTLNAVASTSTATATSTSTYTYTSAAMPQLGSSPFWIATAATCSFH